MVITGDRLTRDEPAASVRVLTAGAQPPAGATLSSTGRLAHADDCRRRGISAQSGQGSCVQPDGTELTAVGAGGSIRLEGLVLRYRGVEVLSRIGDARAPLQPKGVWVRVKLRLTNRLDGTVQFRNDQIALSLGRNLVLGPNSFAADADPRSLEQRAVSLPAGRTVDGAVTFDVPPDAVRKYLPRFTSVQVMTFGENSLSHGRVGLIRMAR